MKFFVVHFLLFNITISLYAIWTYDHDGHALKLSVVKINDLAFPALTMAERHQS